MSDDTADLNRHQPCCTRELCSTGTRRCKTCWGAWPCTMRRLMDERNGLAATIAEIRASMKDDTALCASIRGALFAVQHDHPDVPTSHSAAKRIAGSLVNVIDNIVLRHVEHESGHDIKTLCQEIWKFRHGGNPGQNLDRKTGASRNRSFVKLENVYIQMKARLSADEADRAQERAEAERTIDRLRAEVELLRSRP